MWKIIFENFIFLFFRFPILFSFCIFPFLVFTFHTFHTFHTFLKYLTLGFFPFLFSHLTLAFLTFLKYLTLGNLTLAFLTFHTFLTFLKYLTLGFLHIFSWWCFWHILCQSPHFLYYFRKYNVPYQQPLFEVRSDTICFVKDSFLPCKI